MCVCVCVCVLCLLYTVSVVCVTGKADDMNGCSRMAAYKIAMEMSVKSGDTGDVLLSSQDISMFA